MNNIDPTLLEILSDLRAIVKRNDERIDQLEEQKRELNLHVINIEKRLEYLGSWHYMFRYGCAIGLGVGGAILLHWIGVH